MKNRYIPTCVFTEIVDGVPILEDNRATIWEYYEKGIEELEKYMITNYISKGVQAVLVGVRTILNHDAIGYAVFVQSGFLRQVDPDIS